MTTLEYMPYIAPELSPAVPMSTSDSFSARREKIFLPDAQTTYSYSGNNVLTFTLNSPNECIVGKDSWIEFDLSVAVGGGLNADARLERWIDVGGGHSLFRRMLIQLSNGTTIEDVSGYNKLYSIVRLNSMSADHVRYSEHQAGDGVDSGVFAQSPNVGQTTRPVTFVQAEAAYDHTGGAVEQMLDLSTGGAGRARTELAIGDIIRIETAALNYTARVLTIESDQRITVEGLPAADIAANAILSIVVFKDAGVLTTRARAARTDNIKLKIKPFSNFLSNSKYIPLMFMKNLQFTFELERPEFCFSLSYPQASLPADTTMNYTISNPRFVAQMVTPSQPILEGMLAMYNSPEGIYLPYISYQGNLKLVPAGTSGSITIPANCRSARAFIFAQYLPFQEGVVNPQTYVNECVSLTVKNLMTQFQVKIGSESYPYARPVDTDDIYNGETLCHLQKALDQFNNVLYSTSMIPTNYFAVNTVNGVANESRRFSGGVLLCRDPSSPSTGVDLINNDINFEYARSGPGVDVYLRSFVIHDRALIISSKGTIVFS